MVIRFDESKATQVAVSILKRRGGRMHYIKLLKLLYLVDRASLIKWGTSVTTDHHVSMDNGPVCSNILRLITEENREKPVWSKFISPPMGEFEVELQTQENLPNGKLSRAEEKLIDEVYEEFGYRNRWDLIDNVMHKLPEWQDPHGSAIHIRLQSILEAGEEKPEEIRATMRELRIMAKAAEVLPIASSDQLWRYLFARR
jgi:hypothetical protein